MPRRPRLGPMHPRLTATFALIPAIVALLILLAFLAEELDVRFGNLLTWGFVGVFPGLAFYFGIGLIWRGTVNWTKSRLIAVASTSAAYLAILALVGILLAYNTPGQDDVAIALLLTSLAGCAVALPVASRIVWEPRSAESGAPCPSCGYDLRGQHECRCPECGEQFTVGELVNRYTELET